MTWVTLKCSRKQEIKQTKLSRSTRQQFVQRLGMCTNNAFKVPIRTQQTYSCPGDSSFGFKTWSATSLSSCRGWVSWYSCCIQQLCSPSGEGWWLAQTARYHWPRNPQRRRYACCCHVSCHSFLSRHFCRRPHRHASSFRHSSCCCTQLWLRTVARVSLLLSLVMVGCDDVVSAGAEWAWLRGTAVEIA